MATLTTTDRRQTKLLVDLDRLQTNVKLPTDYFQAAEGDLFFEFRPNIALFLPHGVAFLNAYKPKLRTLVLYLPGDYTSMKLHDFSRALESLNSKVTGKQWYSSTVLSKFERVCLLIESLKPHFNCFEVSVSRNFLTSWSKHSLGLTQINSRAVGFKFV